MVRARRLSGEHGSLTRVTDPLGRITEHEFDDLGNVSALNLPDGAQFLYEYDSLSRLTGNANARGRVVALGLRSVRRDDLGTGSYGD